MHKKSKIPDFSFDDLLTSVKQGADHAAGKITAPGFLAAYETARVIIVRPATQ